MQKENNLELTTCKSECINDGFFIDVYEGKDLLIYETGHPEGPVASLTLTILSPR